jgi:DNA-binding Xre family transcriptional regulator
MQAKEVTIKDVDLKKLMADKGIKNLKQLAKVSGVKFSHLEKCAKGYRIMGVNTWNKIKICL